MRKYLLPIMITLCHMVCGQELEWEIIPFPFSDCETYDIKTNPQGDLFVTGTLGLFRSQNQGNSWECVYNYNTKSSVAARHNSYPMDITSNGRIYIGGAGIANCMLYSDDNGETWHEAPILDDVMVINDIKCRGNDTIFIGLTFYNDQNGSRLAYSFNACSTWTCVNLNEGHDTEDAVEIDISNDGAVYVTCHGYVPGTGVAYKSMDWGETWNLVCGTEKIHQKDQRWGYKTLTAIDSSMVVFNASNQKDMLRESGYIVLGVYGSILVEDTIFIGNGMETNYVSVDKCVSFITFDSQYGAWAYKMALGRDGHLYGTTWNWGNNDTRILRSTNNINTIVGSCTTINEVIPTEATLYPNPVENTLLIISDEMVSIAIYDATGKTMVRTTDKHIDMTMYKPGIYIVSITFNDGRNHVQKIVKK